MDSSTPLTRDALEAFNRSQAHGQLPTHSQLPNDIQPNQTNGLAFNPNTETQQFQLQRNALFRDGLSPLNHRDNHFVRHQLFDTIDGIKVNLAMISCLEDDYELFSQLIYQSVQQMKVDEDSGRRENCETRARMALNQAKQVEHKRLAWQVYSAIMQAGYELPRLSEMWAQAKAFYSREMHPHIFAVKIPHDIEYEVAEIYVQISALECKAMAGDLGIWQED